MRTPPWWPPCTWSGSSWCCPASRCSSAARVLSKGGGPVVSAVTDRQRNPARLLAQHQGEPDLARPAHVRLGRALGGLPVTCLDRPDHGVVFGEGFLGPVLV